MDYGYLFVHLANKSICVRFCLSLVVYAINVINSFCKYLSPGKSLVFTFKLWSSTSYVAICNGYTDVSKNQTYSADQLDELTLCMYTRAPL